MTVIEDHPEARKAPPAFPLTIALLALSLLGILVIAPWIGPESLRTAAVFDRTVPFEENRDAVIFWTIRAPRVALGAVAGAILALAGAVFQGLLRNDLATPYTLGVSGGASFGALLVLQFIFSGTAVGLAEFLLPAGAFAGAALAVAVILLLASRSRGGDRMTTLLLAGVTMNLLFGAGILIIQFVADPYWTHAAVRWMMGGLDVTRIRIPAALVVALAAGAVLLQRQAPALNVMTLGESTAIHLGFDAAAVRLICVITASVLTALVVAFAGPIGFVGLIIPHALRRLIGPDHRRLLPAVLLSGAGFLVLCDAAGRLVSLIAFRGEVEFPVGIITACLGGPFFLWILLRRGHV